MTQRTLTYACGCSNLEVSPGVARCQRKCARHKAFLARQPRGADYYQMIGAIDAQGRPLADHYVAQLIDGFGELPPAPAGGLAVEVGGGATPYVPTILNAGYEYLGVEPDAWAADWTRRTYASERVRVLRSVFPTTLPRPADLLLCAHALEHMRDAPAALRAMFASLRPGGTLLLLVPDDSDPVNPDHLWFFGAEALPGLLTGCGFTDVRLHVRRHTPRENFLYARALRAVEALPRE